MSLQSTSDDMEKLNWFYKVTRDFGVPVVLLCIILGWFMFRFEDRLVNLQQEMNTHQKILQQICVNTAADGFTRSQCWNIR